MEEIKQKLIDLCVDIFAHSDLDYEITLANCGANSFEAAFVAREILNILNINRDDLEEKIEAKISEIDRDL